MTEYIEREKLLAKIDEAFFETDPDGKEQIGVLKCRAIIRESPAADVAPVNWISVKDRLPEQTARCLVARWDSVTKTPFIDILWHENGVWWNRQHGGNYAVTHWMPLPEPPKED